MDEKVIQKKAAVRPIPSRSGYFVGRKHGYSVKKIVKAPSRHPKGSKNSSARRHLVRGVIREISGYATYEKRILECLRNGLDKKALRLAKKKIGSHFQAKKKRENLARILAIQKLQKH